MFDVPDTCFRSTPAPAEVTRKFVVGKDRTRVERVERVERIRIASIAHFKNQRHGVVPTILTRGVLIECQ